MGSAREGNLYMSQALLLRSFFGCISFIIVGILYYNYLLKPDRHDESHQLRRIGLHRSQLQSPIRVQRPVQEDAIITMNNEGRVAVGMSMINRSVARLSWEKIAETSPQYTEVKILTNKFVKNMPLKIVIHARDVNNRPQVTGGDLIYPVINDAIGSYYQTGAIHDFDNGSYLIEFQPEWAGSMSLELTLAYPSRFRRAIVREESYGYCFTCYYAKNLKTSEFSYVRPFEQRHEAYVLADKPSGRCHFDWKPMPDRKGENWCAMDAPEYGNYISCELPGGGVKCEDVFSCVYDSRMPEMAQSKFLSHEPVWSMTPLTNAISSITTIQPSDIAKSSVPCTEFFSGRNAAPKVLGSWTSVNQFVPKCSHSCETTADVIRGVTDSHWYFIGDSTVRQIVQELNCIVTAPSSPCYSDPFKAIQISRAFFPDCRCTTEFQFFGPPVLTSGSLRSFTAETLPYAPNTIDSIVASNASGGDVLVIGSIQHLAMIPFPGFIKRMMAIRDALIRLRRRAPNFKIIWKGSNPCEVTASFFVNNAKVDFYERVAQEIIKDVSSIYIVDTWNMFLGSPFGPAGRHKTHYPTDAVRELLRLLVGIASSKAR